MSRVMKAAVLEETGSPLAIYDDIEIPAPAEGQVLAKILWTGVCHSQVMEARGKRGEDRYLPHLLGHEATAEVVETGEGVTKVSAGDKIVLTWIRGKGCDVPGGACMRGTTSINAGGVTTFNEYSLVSENRCVPLPAGIPLDLGALFGCALPTGGGIVLNTLQPKAGDSLAVWGAGGIGLSAIMLARALGCTTVIAVDVHDEKLALAAEMGATNLVNATREDPVKIVRDLTDGGADYTVDAAGSARTIEAAFTAVRRGGGRCVFASHPAAGERICLDPFELICGKRIEGSWGGATDPDRDIPRYAQLYLDGKLPLERLATHRYTLEQINQALDDVESGTIGRAMIRIGAEDKE